jgi:hypothetical protein
MSERNWQRDMEICQRATPGPWKSVNEPEFDGNIEAPNLGLCIAQGVRAHDKAFIAEAREGWPAALEKIRELEQQIAKMRDVLPDILSRYFELLCDICDKPMECEECYDNEIIERAKSVLKEAK